MRHHHSPVNETISISILTPKPKAALNQVLTFMIVTGLILVGYGFLLISEERAGFLYR